MNIQAMNHLIAGVDEVGRGPLAGPVVAAAVILDPDNPVAGLADSKVLSESKRIALAAVIKQKSLAWSVAEASIDEIDSINILQASLLAMQRAVDQLSLQPVHVQVDGNRLPVLSMSAEAIVKGDSRVAAIAAASILAKVNRDSQMEQLDLVYPGYGFAQHKGYPTKQHLSALEKLGPCEIHRRSFAPVKKFISVVSNDG